MDEREYTIPVVCLFADVLFLSVAYVSEVYFLNASTAAVTNKVSNVKIVFKTT